MQQLLNEPYLFNYIIGFNDFVDYKNLLLTNKFINEVVSENVSYQNFVDQTKTCDCLTIFNAAISTHLYEPENLYVVCMLFSYIVKEELMMYTRIFKIACQYGNILLVKWLYSTELGYGDLLDAHYYTYYPKFITHTKINKWANGHMSILNGTFKGNVELFKKELKNSLK